LNFSAFKGHLFAASFTLAVLLGVIEYCSDKGKATLPFKICGLFILGLLSKETALAAVALSFLYVALFARSELKRLANLGLALGAISAVYLWFRFSYLTPPAAFPRRFEYSTLESFAFYLRTLAAPYPSCLERTLPAGPSWILWLGGFAALVWLLRKSKESLFALAWIPATLLPFLHLISFSNVSPVADRYLYLPAAGLCLLLARLLGRARRGEFVLAGVVALWTSITFARNFTYRSTRALFEQTASCAPRNPRAQFLLGMVCFQEKDYPAARAAYERVLALTDSPGAREALEEIGRAEKLSR
jgi:tetratricopeptide (TPR) repeat protein